MKWQKGWPPVRQETVEEIEDETRAWRAIPGISLKKSGTSYHAPLEGKKDTLKGEFGDDMKRAFSEEDQLHVFDKFVQRIMHGRAGYGGQTRERAEGIVLRMWQELAEETGGF